MSFDETYPAPPSAPGTIRVQDAALPLYQSKGWLKLVAVLMIVGGVFYAITIVGIVIAWLPIWMGVLLWQTADNIEQARNSGNAEQFMVAQQKLKTYFTITGVTALISIILVAITFLLFGAVFLASIREGVSLPA